MARVKRYPLTEGALKELQGDIEKLFGSLPEISANVCEKLTKHAEEDFNLFVSAATPGRQAVISTETQFEKHGKYGNVGRLTATGKTEHDDEYGDFNILMAVEFGAGIVAAGANNPNFTALGYGAGSYNEHGHALDPSGWFYPSDDFDDDNKHIWRHTLGTPATMPMHRTILDTKANLTRYAAEELYKWLNT